MGGDLALGRMVSAILDMVVVIRVLGEKQGG